MALNQIERAMLVAARTYLADKRHSRICFAITAAEIFMSETMPPARREQIKQAGKRLREFIMSAIDPHVGYECWLAKSPVEDHRLLNSHERRAARIAWIDWLLDEPWTDHNGSGACPSLPDEIVTVRLRSGETSQGYGDTFRWEHWEKMPSPMNVGGPYDIVAYKIIYEAPKC